MFIPRLVFSRLSVFELGDRARQTNRQADGQERKTLNAAYQDGRIIICRLHS